ncbi:hypothetical protein PHAVU_011G158000 [Phaseolus vulgaris]|uniref:RING-type E3 ubiquitin transferase n=1 Tax=Phaseolus vulgaris TaxID=3885 RepID=V7AM15_PHAVU|nr:hypothetical protein PHAVU_011G158000g [Phaseolus vulgaris]ESW05171.1 hypothetical protein PHAVU_011G158000g [Phaseolus vulgaris]
MFPLHPNKNKIIRPVIKQLIMDQNNTVPRIHAFSAAAPPSPPMFSFIIALSIAALIFMCFHVFSGIASAAILLALCITTLFLCRFTHDRELREAASFHAQTPQNNHRVVKILNKLFWVVEYKRGGQRQQVKKLLGSIVCFENQALVSGSECAICLEEFKKGEKCLVFSFCGHTFHCDCINTWFEEKPTCPNCRYVPSATITSVDIKTYQFTI